MRTLRGAQVALGISLLAALGIAMGCMASGDVATADVEPLGEAREAQAIDQPPPLPPGCLVCTVSSETSSTGRAWGSICVTRQQGICCRRRIGGDAPPLYPSCHETGRTQLGCATIIDC